jgi:hypothetical protein
MLGPCMVREVITLPRAAQCLLPLEVTTCLSSLAKPRRPRAPDVPQEDVVGVSLLALYGSGREQEHCQATVEI